MDIVVKYIVEAALGGIIGAALGYMATTRKRSTALPFGVKALLRDRILQEYGRWGEAGYCPIYARENVEDMYTAYHNLGGNGTITRIMEVIRELPTDKPKEA